MHYLDMGTDIANYLETMNTFFGEDVRGTGLLRPPLIALPLKLFTLAFGDLNGAKILGVFVSVAIGIPFYFLLKRICHPLIAVAISLLFVLTPAYGNMLGWGYLTMIAIFFILLFTHFFLLIFEAPSKRNIILAGFSASMVVGFHQLSLTFFIFLFLLFLFTLLLFNREALLRSYKPLSIALILGGIFSLPYLPTYINMIRTQSTEGGIALSSTITINEIGDQISALGWSWWIIFIVVIMAAFALRWIWRQDRNRALLLAVWILFSTGTNCFPISQPLSRAKPACPIFSLYTNMVTSWFLPVLCLVIPKASLF